MAKTDVKGLVWTARPLAGRREGMSARRPTRGRAIKVCLCTSVTASRMTDAYGASTLTGVARRPTMGYRLEMRIIPENISIPASEGCPFPRHRSRHEVPTTDVKGMVKTPRPLVGRREGMSARRPARGRGGRVCFCTSVTASRMTDAYGTSTLTGAIARVSYSCFYTKCRLSGGEGLPLAGGRRIFSQEEAERDKERLYETTPPDGGAIFARWCEPKGALRFCIFTVS